jgi:GT2 family glycosyltransferase/glycosyltransferase involved in cell wall biosynthesis
MNDLMATSVLRSFSRGKILIKCFLRVLAFILTPLGAIRLFYLKFEVFFSKKIQDENSMRIKFNNFDKAIVIFAPIDWQYRHQRPQNLAESFTKTGKNVFYFNPTVEYKSGNHSDIYIEQIDYIWICTIRSNVRRQSFYIGTNGIPHQIVESVAKQIEDLLSRNVGGSALLIVQQPSWWPLMERLQGNQILFDCMDLHSGFSVIDPLNVKLESFLGESSDQIVVTSEFLRIKKISEQGGSKSVKLIRNGVDSMRFAIDSKSDTRNVVGYFGALAEWFDLDLMEWLVGANQDLKFEIIGLITNSEIYSRLRKYKNVVFYGEVPNRDLPKLVAGWGAGLIPFKLSQLIIATNPVKMYEYAAMGIPTVASDIPEVGLVSSNLKGVFTSKSFDEFNKNLHVALNLNDKDREELKNWSKKQDWSQRAAEILEHSSGSPKVSVVVLMWNQGLMTLKCLLSIVERSDYPNLEIILVDNDSKLEESAIVTNWLNNISAHKIKYIRNSENLGFAEGNNVGLREATGDYLVILNNDTEVSPGWIWRSLKHFYRDSNLGILGPSTDNCGNEARVKLRGNPSDWLSEVVPRFNFRIPQLVEVNTVAFFCVFIPRNVFEKVGMIGTEYKRGYFEDDDYCRRVQSMGYKIGIARDIFIHHKSGASFDLIGDSEKTKLFIENKAIYEAKWGKWVPHTYALDSDQS